MSILPIITLPEPILRQRAEPVERVDDSLRKTLDDMLETMYDAPGIGLAANQVGIARRFIVVDASKRGEAEEDAEKAEKEAPPNPIFLINPEIVASSDQMRTFEEGCLSLPDVHVEIERPRGVTVRYIDRDGNQQELEADGLLATVIQHEIDHLDGRLIIDYLSSLRRNMIVRRFKKLSRQS